MKYLPLILLLLMGCGVEGPMGPAGPEGIKGATGATGVAGTNGVDGDDGKDGAPGKDGKDAPTPTSLEGYYLLPDGGYLDIYEDAQGLYTIRQARLVLSNADGSKGLIPITTATSLPLVNNKLYVNVNSTYVAATHNVKQDSNATALVGSFLTSLIISKEGVRVIVNNNFSVVFDHSVVMQ